MSSDSNRISYRARWIFSPGRDPLENACVVVNRDTNRIEHFETGIVSGAVDLGNVALIPQLVNAHVHLEFSHLTSPVQPASPFTDWIRNVIATRNDPTVPMTDRIEAGTQELTSNGTGRLGEIATSDLSEKLLAASSLGAVLFHEMIGLTDERVLEQKTRLRMIAEKPSVEGCRHAVSPHAPYTVREDLLEEIVRFATENQMSVCMHLAEQPAERDLLVGKGGLFRAFLESLGLYRQADWNSKRTILDLLKQLADAPSALVIHGNDLQSDEIDFLAQQPQMTVVYCPRTHAYFGHTPHSWKRLLDRGANVALGTDGRSSNPDLNLFEEVKYLARYHPEVAPKTLLELASVAGSKALGFGDESGLYEGDRFRVTCLLSLPERETDPWKAIMSPNTQSSRLIAE